MPSTSPEVVIAIDAGTTGVRAFAVDTRGRPVGAAYREFTQHFPTPGWVEHDASEIWDVTQDVLARVVSDLATKAGADAPPLVAAIGITNQRETVVAWDRRTGQPRHRAIVWQDRRTAERCGELTASGELSRVRAATGLVLDPYFSATKMEWLIRSGEVVVDDDLALGTIDSWLLWNLTGGEVYATEPSNASRTMLYDLRTRDWSEELTDLFGVPRSLLAEIRPTAGTFGTTASACSIGAGIPITGVAGDQQSSLFGHACLNPGMAKNTYGTGSFVLMNVGDALPEPTEGLLTTVAWQLPAATLGAGDGLVTHYALEGAIFVTGAAIQWLRDGLGIIDDASAVGPLAESVDGTDGVVVVPAFTGLGAPYWDPYARGTVLGITRGTGRAHLARAVVESMAFQTRDVVDAMVSASGTSLSELRVDGGAAAMELLLRLQADQLGVVVTRADVTETTALGAAYLAGLGVGIWSTAAELASTYRASTRVEPSADRDDADRSHAQWRRAVERSRAWV